MGATYQQRWHRRCVSTKWWGQFHADGNTTYGIGVGQLGGTRRSSRGWFHSGPQNIYSARIPGGTVLKRIKHGWQSANTVDNADGVGEECFAYVVYLRDRNSGCWIVQTWLMEWFRRSRSENAPTCAPSPDRWQLCVATWSLHLTTVWKWYCHKYQCRTVEDWYFQCWCSLTFGWWEESSWILCSQIHKKKSRSCVLHSSQLFFFGPGRNDSKTMMFIIPNVCK